jgi:hypothetical protein
LDFHKKFIRDFLKIKVKREGNLYPMGIRVTVEQSHVHVCIAFFSEEEFTMLSCLRFRHLRI